MYQLKGPIEVYLAEKQKLIKRYADRDENGNLIVQDGKYIVTKEKESFADEYRKLTDMEININKPTIQLGQWAQGHINTDEIRELFSLIQFTFQGAD